MGLRVIDPGFARTAFERYARQLRHYLRRRSGRAQDVDDLAQEVYLRLLRIDPATRVMKPLAFVYGVAARVVADHKSRSSQTEEVVVSADEVLGDWLKHPSEAPDARLEEQLAMRQQLERALTALPPLHAAILVLHKRDGLSYEEVARQLGVSLHTVHKYLTESRAQLRMMCWDR